MTLLIDLCQEVGQREAGPPAKAVACPARYSGRKRQRESPIRSPLKVVHVDLSCEPDTETNAQTQAAELPQLPDCPICLEEVSSMDSFTVSSCGHSLHFACARATVLDAISTGSVPIMCPACQAGEGDCRRSCSSRKSKASEVQDWCCSIDADLELLLTSEEMDTYHQRVLPAAALRSQELKQCPQADCIGLAVAEQGEPKLVCCKCEHEWCSSCKVPWHGGKSCEQVKQEASAAPADAAFDQYMEKTQTLRCPTCSRALQKSEGCNRIRCVCSTQLCWLCGTILERHDPYGHFRHGACKDKVYTR